MAKAAAVEYVYSSVRLERDQWNWLRYEAARRSVERRRNYDLSRTIREIVDEARRRPVKPWVDPLTPRRLARGGVP